MMPLPREEAKGACASPDPSLQLLVEKIPAVLWTTNRHFRLTSLAGAGLSNMELRAEDYVGRPLHEFLPGSPLDPTALMAHTHALEGHSSDFDVAIRGRDLKGHVEPLRDGNGTVIGVIGVALDNTEFRLAERALRISEQNYRSLFEGAPYAICRSTPSGQLLQVNRAMVEMLGHASEEDLLLLDVGGEIFSDEAAWQEFLRQIVGSISCHGFECAWRHRESRKLVVRLGGRAVRDEQGEMFYVEILAENVTEFKQLEEQLRQGQKMQAIGQLAGGIAHDFNNLLTVIKGHVECILSNGQGGLSQAAALQEVQRAADRASMLTQRLLAFSRRQILKPRVLDVNQVIGGASQILGRLIGENIELVFLPEPELGNVRADPTQMEQLLMNLVVNGRDAIQGNGTITIRTLNVILDVDTIRCGVLTPAGSYVAMTISDTGQGMDAETRAHIFEPFFTTKKDHGTGLGLATVYGVVKQSGGHIWVHSEPGRGTTFEIYLPRVSESAEARPAPVPVRASGGNETILFVEDEPSIRELVTEFLTAKGYQVLAASNGMWALKIARSHWGTIDLLLSDLCMPKLGGMELAAELRSSHSHLKVIFVSGYPGDAIVQKPAEDVGAPILQKPFEMRYLAKAVRCVLDGMEVPAPEAG